MYQLLIDKVRNVCKLALLFMVVAGTSFAWLPRVAAQETTFDVVRKVVSPGALGTVPRDDFFSTESLDDKAKLLSEELLLKALDSEAFYTLVGQLKPVSEGFWGGYFSVEPADLTEIEQVRAALRSWNVPGMFFADVLVYESLQHGQRYASAYVIHIPSLKNLIQRESEFFARWGIRQVATFAGRSGRFVYAVPKLSRPGPEDIALQRRAALFLTEYKRLRPQYTAPTKNPSGLLRDWMDDGHGKCHPDHLLAKLPAKTESELDAEIASWSAAEVRPPEVKFNHLYVVLSQADFDALRTSDFLLNQFAALDQGFPKFLAVDGPCQSIYLRGRDTYIELFGPENKFGEPVGKMGMGWSVEKVGDLDVLQGLLTKDSPDSFTRVLNQWDFDREGAAVNWYHSLFRKQSSTSDAVWWFSETHVDFIPALYPEKSSDGDRISRQDFLASRYDATRILKNFTNLTIHLPLEAARSLRSDLDQVGWRSEEFDSRTWILRGPDFRLMIIVQPEGANARLSSIGFESNPGFETQSQQSLGDEMEVSFDGKQSGWIVFK